jgi:hypothetical protein
MEITKDIITDLLPGYLADEVSEDSRRLVESWFAKDPAFAALSRKLAPSPSRETAALSRTRSLLRTRNTWLGFAIAYSLAPFSFWASTEHGLRWMMLRDSPMQAAFFAACGLGCWIAWAIFYRRSASSGV